MSSALETLRLLADPTRLRLLRLLDGEELSVAELQEILAMGQSRISSHLSMLRQGGLVTDRKEGKRSYYSLGGELPSPERALVRAACEAASDTTEGKADAQHLRRVLERRSLATERYFNEVAGRLGRNYCPGRSWEAVAHLLFQLVPPLDVADLGAGEGTLSQLIARRARSIVCIDNSARMIEVGTESARQHGLANLTYKRGDIEDVPLPAGSVDLALLSQALHHARRPARAISEAFRILRPGGQVVILDLKEHDFEKARELYADLWLGFTERSLQNFLTDAGFTQIEIRVVARELKEPGFETLLATAVKPAV